MKTEADAVGIPVAEYARLRGVSPKAVHQRIAAGSLPTSAKRAAGRWVITDAALADAEWAAHTQPRVTERPTPGIAPSGLAIATQREREARANSLELELARKTRALVPAREVEQRWSGLVVGARTKLLGLPSRFKQRVPETSASALVVLDELIREALEELADERSGEHHV